MYYRYVCIHTYTHKGPNIRQEKARLLVLDILLDTTLSNLEFQEEYLF
jgi:hypothetical protein